ncbi:hypothetical protein [Chryseobacterium sp. G0240]|uniref:hypothetical protein n=1 Tax=Chryseobacterium sp. G0240 TaxID=2487066 RepID=UPI000F45EE22|nr:hypothetical protein [Chryseobacterium sp. G0240]
MQVVNQKTKDLVWIEGIRIEAPNWELAQEIIDKENYHYLKITGQLIAEIPCKEGGFEPDWKNAVDYDKLNQN